MTLKDHFLIYSFLIIGLSQVDLCYAQDLRNSHEPLPFAVVELFTSEGCPSCPPADALLSALSKDISVNHLRVYPLSFHVTYWNQRGWKDPYSSPIFTERQYLYQRTWGSSEVYTPQMIVNGREAFTGSDGSKAKASIVEGLKHPAQMPLSIASVSWPKPEMVSVQIQITGATNSALLQVALVENSITNQISKGENRGKVIMHSNVVRSFKTIRLSRNNVVKTDLPVPSGANKKGLSVIAYAQDIKTLMILGAASLDLP